MSQESFQRELASYEHEQDLYKHTATLSTGALVLLSTFMEKLFQRPVSKGWLGVALVAFVASIGGAVVMQLMSVLHVDRRRDLPEGKAQQAIFWITFPLTFGGFMLGIVCLLVFALCNLRPW